MDANPQRNLWPDDTDVVVAGTPIAGWRRLRIVNFDGIMRFSGLNPNSGSGRYFDATPTRATCGLGLAHHAPQWACSCGWYACETRETARALTSETRRRNDIFDAHVQLGGTIIESEHGWRSEWQHIDSINVNKHCHCGRPVTHLRHTHPLDKHIGRQRGLIEYVGGYIAVCKNHTAPTTPRHQRAHVANIEHAVTLAEAATQLGVAVNVDRHTPTDAEGRHMKQHRVGTALLAGCAMSAGFIWLTTLAAANINDVPAADAPTSEQTGNPVDRIALIADTAAASWPASNSGQTDPADAANTQASVSWLVSSTVDAIGDAGADNIAVTSAGPDGLDATFTVEGASYRLTINAEGSELTADT